MIKLTKYFDSHLDLWGRTVPGSYLNDLQNLVADSGNLISLCGPIPRKAVPQKLYDSDLFNNSKDFSKYYNFFYFSSLFSINFPYYI